MIENGELIGADVGTAFDIGTAARNAGFRLPQFQAAAGGEFAFVGAHAELREQHAVLLESRAQHAVLQIDAVVRHAQRQAIGFQRAADLRRSHRALPAQPQLGAAIDRVTRIEEETRPGE